MGQKVRCWRRAGMQWCSLLLLLSPSPLLLLSVFSDADFYWLCCLANSEIKVPFLTISYGRHGTSTAEACWSKQLTFFHITNTNHSTASIAHKNFRQAQNVLPRQFLVIPPRCWMPLWSLAVWDYTQRFIPVCLSSMKMRGSIIEWSVHVSSNWRKANSSLCPTPKLFISTHKKYPLFSRV